MLGKLIDLTSISSDGRVDNFAVSRRFFTLAEQWQDLSQQPILAPSLHFERGVITDLSTPLWLRDAWPLPATDDDRDSGVIVWIPLERSSLQSRIIASYEQEAKVLLDEGKPDASRRVWNLASRELERIAETLTAEERGALNWEGRRRSAAREQQEVVLEARLAYLAYRRLRTPNQTDSKVLRELVLAWNALIEVHPEFFAEESDPLKVESLREGVREYASLEKIELESLPIWNILIQLKDD